jgi:hypothetical protein
VRFPAEPAVPIPRRWAWALGIGVAVLAGLLVWLLLAGRGAAPPVAESVQSALEAAQRRVMGPVPPAAPAAPAAREANGGPAHGVDEYEICGGTWVKANADGNVDDQALKGPMRRDDAARAVAQALAADARPVAQAARLVLQAMGGDDGRRALIASMAGCGTEACTAASGVPAAALDAATASRESLARLAAASADPAAYALAFRMCGSGAVRIGACGLLSAEQWARLDPGNAAPWQEVLAAAQARKDNAAANEALHRIATSQRSDQRFFDLAGLVVDAAPDDDSLRNGVFMLALETIGFQAAWAVPAYQPVLSACKREMLRDSNRRQTCEAIAELMAEKSDTMVERMMGGAVGRQLGWPEARIERMRAEQSAFAESMYAGIDMRDAMGCEAVKRLTDDVRRMARLGEVGAMRDWLAHDAPPADELLRRYRAEQRESADRNKAYAAAQAASAASTPN